MRGERKAGYDGVRVQVRGRERERRDVRGGAGEGLRED